jgi:quercetin dioxygenase-like cupin family protein
VRVISTRIRHGAVAVAATAALAATSTTALAAPSTGDATETDGVTTTVLGLTQPPNAAGRTLSLEQVVIDPGAHLSPQQPAGTQVVRIESGRLEFRVISGHVSVSKAGGTPETVKGPTTIELRAGDTVIQTAGVERAARNQTERPVRAIVAALLPEGAALSSPATDDESGTPLHLDTVLSVTDSALVTVGPLGQYRYGTVTETGTSQVDGEEVRVDVTAQVRYTDGNGPFWGVLTLTFPDGSTIGASFTGATLATEEGGAQFASTVGVIGGTGRYADVTSGSGTYKGSRPAAAGTEPLTTEIDLNIVSG